MKNEHRRSERYDDIGRVDAHQICALPGVLDDISLTGCKVHFPIPVNLDMERDFELKIRPAYRSAKGSLSLLCHPEWKKSNGTQTHIGFSILRSPNTRELRSYIDVLKEKNFDASDISNLIITSAVTFVS